MDHASLTRYGRQPLFSADFDETCRKSDDWLKQNFVFLLSTAKIFGLNVFNIVCLLHQILKEHSKESSLLTFFIHHLWFLS
jgi:hypothetical protein